MGADLAAGADGKKPRFLIRVLRDPDGANLDRVQIIKGWLNADGTTSERIYDVACGGRDLNSDGCDGSVGNTVDAATATWANDIGEPNLSAFWEDPAFDPSQSAFYYVRVLEIPTPRWTTYDSVVFGVDVPERIPLHIQERAYTSPIGYTPRCPHARVVLDRSAVNPDRTPEAVRSVESLTSARREGALAASASRFGIQQCIAISAGRISAAFFRQQAGITPYRSRSKPMNVHTLTLIFTVLMLLISTRASAVGWEHYDRNPGFKPQVLPSGAVANFADWNRVLPYMRIGPGIEIAPQPVTDKVWMFDGLFYAPVVVETEEGLLVFSTGENAEEGRLFRKLIREQISEKPIIGVFYDHAHYPFGAATLLEGDEAVIVARPDHNRISRESGSWPTR